MSSKRTHKSSKSKYKSGETQPLNGDNPNKSHDANADKSNNNTNNTIWRNSSDFVINLLRLCCSRKSRRGSAASESDVAFTVDSSCSHSRINIINKPGQHNTSSNHNSKNTNQRENEKILITDGQNDGDTLTTQRTGQIVEISFSEHESKNCSKIIEEDHRENDQVRLISDDKAPTTPIIHNPGNSYDPPSRRSNASGARVSFQIDHWGASTTKSMKILLRYTDQIGVSVMKKDGPLPMTRTASPETPDWRPSDLCGTFGVAPSTLRQSLTSCPANASPTLSTRAGR